MRTPRLRTGGVAMGLVVLAVLLTSPLLTAFATNLLDVNNANPDALQSELAFATGGAPLRAIIVLTASALLLFAANTAIVGAYHVFGALADGDFLPRAFVRRHDRFGTPYIAIIASVAVPITVLLVTRGDIGILGDLYAFGLLGAFVLSSSALDRVRISEGRTGLIFAVGVATTLLIVVAFVTNLFEKPQATLFGGSLTLVMLAYGLVHRGELRLGRSRRGPDVTTEEAERIAAEKPAAARILTLQEAQDLQPTYAPRTLVCLRGSNLRLLEEVATRLAGARQEDVAVLFVEEVPGLYRATSCRRATPTRCSKKPSNGSRSVDSPPCPSGVSRRTSVKRSPPLRARSVAMRSSSERRSAGRSGACCVATCSRV
jgi:hypothetical protein